MKQTFRHIVFSFFILISASIFNPAQAQDYAGAGYGFRLGLTAHPSIGWIKPDGGKGDGISFGFSYGLLADLNFAENYSFGTGLTVTTINGKSTETFNNTYANGSPLITGNLKYKLQYLEVPLTVKLKTEKNNGTRWYGQFGLSNDFNISAKQDILQIGSGAGNTSANDIDIKDDINFYRAGLVIGAGLEYDIAKSTSITTGLTFNNGLTDISDDKSRKVKNHYVSINFGILF